MSDIVERLRHITASRVCQEAADEIERLRAPDGTYAALLDARAEIERLKAALRAVVQERKIDIARAALEL